VPFGGEASNNVIDKVDNSTVVTIQSLLSAGKTVGISGNYIVPGTQITATDSVEQLTLSNNIANGNNVIVTNLVYWDATLPSAAGGDQPIQAVLVLAPSHADFRFIDVNGNNVNIPAGTLVKGAVYYFQIMEVITVSSGEFLGYAAN
jgi:hypothetical protein